MKQHTNQEQIRYMLVRKIEFDQLDDTPYCIRLLNGIKASRLFVEGVVNGA